MDAVTHLKPGKYKLITAAGPTAPVFILLLTDLSVSPSCLLSTDNKETKHFTPPLYESFPSAKQMPFFETPSYSLFPTSTKIILSVTCCEPENVISRTFTTSFLPRTVGKLSYFKLSPALRSSDVQRKFQPVETKGDRLTVFIFRAWIKQNIIRQSKSTPCWLRASLLFVPCEGGVKWEVSSAVRNSRVSGWYFVPARAICTVGRALLFQQLDWSLHLFVNSLTLMARCVYARALLPTMLGSNSWGGYSNHQDGSKDEGETSSCRASLWRFIYCLINKAAACANDAKSNISWYLLNRRAQLVTFSKGYLK